MSRAMKESSQQHTRSNSLRYGMIVPMVLMIASLLTGCFSYSSAKRCITDDLNDAMITLANENSELWTRQDTVAALRKMHETTHKPLIYQAYDVNFRSAALKANAYFSLALVDRKYVLQKIHGDKIVSDSILLVPEKATDGEVVRLQGFADCSMASVFAASDQSMSGIPLVLSFISMASVFVYKKKVLCRPEPVSSAHVVIDMKAIKLTPMQRQLTQMLLDAPDRKVDKSTLCATLWGNKSNAEESLYTLVRRTKTALAAAGVEIVCNRGESYELRINS